LANFLALRARQPALEWDPYIVPFQHIDETLLESGILVEGEGYQDAHALPTVEAIRKAIEKCKPSWASADVIHHDTMNCALVLFLRQTHPPDERGQKVWFLTIDRTLRRAQKLLYRAQHISAPYCMQVGDWGELVLPAQNRLTFVFDDFIGYLAQARLGAIGDPNAVQLDFLETITDSQLDVDRLIQMPVEQVRASLVALQASREVRSLAHEAARSPDPARRETSRTQLQLVLDEAIAANDPMKIAIETTERKNAILAEKLKAQEAANIELRAKVSRLESSWFYRIWHVLSSSFMRMRRFFAGRGSDGQQAESLSGNSRRERRPPI